MNCKKEYWRYTSEFDPHWVLMESDLYSTNGSKKYVCYRAMLNLTMRLTSIFLIKCSFLPCALLTFILLVSILESVGVTFVYKLEEMYAYWHLKMSGVTLSNLLTAIKVFYHLISSERYVWTWNEKIHTQENITLCYTCLG